MGRPHLEPDRPWRVDRNLLINNNEKPFNINHMTPSDRARVQLPLRVGIVGVDGRKIGARSIS